MKRWLLAIAVLMLASCGNMSNNNFEVREGPRFFIIPVIKNGVTKQEIVPKERIVYRYVTSNNCHVSKPNIGPTPVLPLAELKRLMVTDKAAYDALLLSHLEELRLYIKKYKQAVNSNIVKHNANCK